MKLNLNCIATPFSQNVIWLLSSIELSIFKIMEVCLTLYCSYVSIVTYYFSTGIFDQYKIAMHLESV